MKRLRTRPATGSARRDRAPVASNAPAAPARQRLDVLLVARGLAESREKAVRLIMAGAVRVGERPADKPGTLIAAAERVEVLAGNRFVSRGGHKLLPALEAFGVSPRGRVCLDVGASTGGFTHCLLERGAERVYAVDVGHGQLDANLRADGRVVVMERTNARALSPNAFPETPDLA